MKKFKVRAKVVSFVCATVEANSIEEANEIAFADRIDRGDFIEENPFEGYFVMLPDETEEV